MDSGFSRYQTTSGVNPFNKYNVLSFMEQARDIRGDVITDLIVASKERVDNGIINQYAVGNTGRVYRIQVNDPITKNPDYDTAVLVTTLVVYTLASATGFNAGNAVTDVTTGGTGTVVTVNGSDITIDILTGTFNNGDTITDTTTSNTTTISAATSPTLNYGASIEFYSNKLFVGHDLGVTFMTFAGTGQTPVSPGSWATNVPRPAQLFIGNIYFGNSNNIAEITSGLTATTLGKINPAFPIFYQIRDLDVTSDGVYLEMTMVRCKLGDITVTTPDANTQSTGAIDSQAAYWNGVNSGATSFISYPNYAQSAYATFGQNEFIFGNDPISATLSTPLNKILTLENSYPPLPGAISPIGNLIAWMSPESTSAGLVASLHAYGQFDQETAPSHYRLGSFASTIPSGTGDVLKVPLMIPASNYSLGGDTSGYTGDVIGTSKIYFSTIEYDGLTTKYGFYAFSLYPIGTGNSIGGIYETLAQLFAKKVVCKQVRIYLEPAAAGQSFQADIIGIDGTALSDASLQNTFTEGASSLEPGETLAWYNPKCQPSPAIGIRITNLGTVTPFIHKIELDIAPSGK